MREPNRPSSSANSNPSGGQPPPNYPPTQSTPANPQGVRASFTVVAPQGGMPHGHTLPPPTVARVASQSMSSGQQPPQLHPHQPMSPQQQQIENLLHVLSANDGTPRVDLKLQQLKEFFKNYEELSTSPAYLNNAKTFLTLLIRQISDTVAHFVAENETQELRKLVLEALFRMSFMNEHVRQYAKEIQKLLLNVVMHDNEENAMLALKILADHLRGLRLQFTPEIATFFAQIRVAYRNFVDAIDQRADFFNIQPSGISGSIEEEVQQSLPGLYFAKTIHMEQRGGTSRFDYTILPRAIQSVRVFSELPSFLLSLNQLHRQHVYEEVIELLPTLIRFVCVQVQSTGSNQNKPMMDEFHMAQIRALNFVAFVAKNTQLRQQNYPQRALIVIEEHADSLVSAINQLLESLNPYAGVSRREFIVAIKLLFESDLKHRFVGVVERLTSDKILLGQKFTSQDHLRYILYHNLADLLYKIRAHLTYPMLLHSIKVCIRCIHDNQLLPNYQMMYLKLMRSLCEPLIEHESRYSEPAREVLILSMEALVRKLQVIADYYLPSIVQQLEKPALKRDPSQQYPPTSPQKEPIQGTSTTTELKSDKDPDVGADPKQDNQPPQLQDQTPQISPSDCRNMVKLIFLPAQEIAARLSKCHLSETTTSMYAERELFEQLFIQSIRCLEVFKIVSAAAAAQTAQLSAQLKSSLAKDEKETVETFTSVFQDADPKMFRYIFSRQINFFIDSFVANQSVQLVCKMFLTSDKTFTTTGSILMKHMLKHMSELGASPLVAIGGTASSSSSSNQPTSDKTQVYLRLFREIFHIVSGMNNDQQPQRVATSAADRQARSKEHEAMLIPYLHQIVSDSIQLALRSRDPHHYFALLHALFRSIGTGSHDQLYQQFLPLLPSILQQLNRFQNGSYRQPIHDLYVELCLTVPVRLSSLLPYLPLLMDPLVCALHGPSKLVMQGLRTLELFVNNLQLDYVYDQMLPVRAALMQGIWRALYTQEIHYAMLALKILGKLGGSSRRAFLDAQNFNFVDLDDIRNSKSIGPRALYAAGHSTYNQEPPKLCLLSNVELVEKPDQTSGTANSGPQKRKSDDKEDGTEPKRRQLEEDESGEKSEEIPAADRKPSVEVLAELPMAQIVESALGMIRSAMVNEPSPPLHVNWAHWLAGSTTAGSTSGGSGSSASANKMPKQQAVEVCKTIVLQAIEGSPLLKMHEEEKLRPIFKQALQKYIDNKQSGQNSKLMKPKQFVNPKSRAVIGSALTGLFYAAVSPELRPQSLSAYRAIVSHLTLQALLESMQVEVQELVEDEGENLRSSNSLDGSLLIDVICQTLSDSCKHFCQAGIVALRFINIMVKSLFDGDDEELNNAYELPFFRLLLRRINQLSYRRDWYAKLGGCTALRFFIDHFTREFVIKNSNVFLNAFFTTISGLADEVSYGAVDVASKSLDQFIDVCFGPDANGQFDSNTLDSIVSLIAENLANAEQQLRLEANRLLLRLRDLIGRTKKELLAKEMEKMERKLRDGFAQFSSMSIGSQLGFLDFFTQHLNDLQLASTDSYTDQSQSFASNLMVVLENTDIALHSMPSSRYSITNLPGSPHSLEDQMRMLRSACVDALREHAQALITLKEKHDERMGEEEKKEEKLWMALSVLDIERIQTKKGASPSEKQLERMRWTVRYAYELAELSLPSTTDFTLEQFQRAKEEIEKASVKLKEENSVRSRQSNERELLIRRLDVLVEFLLQLTIHPIHPMKKECRELLRTIISTDSRFKLRVHAEIHRQLSQMQPIAILNDEVECPEQALKDLKPTDRLKFMPHATSVDSDSNGQLAADRSPTSMDENGDGTVVETRMIVDIGPPNTALITLDLNDPQILDALLEGQLSVQVEDQEGQIIAVGQTVSFGPVDQKARKSTTQLVDSNLSTHQKGLEDFENGQGDVKDREEEDEQMQVEEEDKEPNNETNNQQKQKTYAVVGREGEKFQLDRYEGKMPPAKPGTFVTLTTLPSGHQIRSIRNFSSDMIRELADSIEICQQVETCVEEAAELQRRQELLLVGGLDANSSGMSTMGGAHGGRSYSMSFNEDVDEATKAQLHKVANMLMLEAQSLGLDQPSSYTVTVRPAGQVAATSRSPQKRRTSSGVSAADFQDLMDMSDTDLREIGEELIQHLPDFRSPEKQTPEYAHSSHQYPSQQQVQPAQEPYMDPVQEVVASMRAAAAQKQIQESQQQQMMDPQQQFPAQHQGSQYGYQSSPYHQQTITSGPMPMPSGHIQQTITSSPMPYAQAYPQPQSYPQQHHPSATQSPMPPQPHSVPTQAPVVEDTQRYEQENGLDAEYALRQHASGTNLQQGSESDQFKPEQQGEGPESMDTNQRVELDGQKEDKDKDLDEYLLVQTKESWKPPIVVNVPVGADGRAEFSRAQIAVDQEIKVENDGLDQLSNENKFAGQLDGEPVIQQSKQPFNPILLSSNGDTVEADSIKNGDTPNDQLNESSDQLNSEEVEQVLEANEQNLRAKDDESASLNGSEDSFEFVTMDKDELLGSGEKIGKKSREVKEQLEEQLKDLTKKHSSSTHEDPQKSSEQQKDIILNVKGIDSNQLTSLEIDSQALELMQNLSSTKAKMKQKKQQGIEGQFVLKTNKGRGVDEEAKTFDDLSDVKSGESEKEEESSTDPTPYSHVTDPRLRRLLNQLHSKSPERAEDAVQFYVKRMSNLLQKEYRSQLKTDDAGIRLEFAHESVRLPTGHLVETMPRTEFNYLPDEVFEELKAFDQIDDELQKEVDSLADQLRLHPKISDSELEQLFEYQSVDSNKLSALADLRSLIDARIPSRLLDYLAGEIGQMFKLDVRDESQINEETLKQLDAGLQLMCSPGQKRPLDFLLNALSFVGELNENLDIQEDQFDQLLKSLTVCLALEAPKVIEHILTDFEKTPQSDQCQTQSSLINPCLQVLSCRRIIQLIFERPEAENLRQELLKELSKIEKLMNLSNENEKDKEMADETMEEKTPQQTQGQPSINACLQVQIDCCLLQLIHITLSQPSSSTQSTTLRDSAISLVHRFWRSSNIEQRYTARRSMLEVVEQNHSNTQTPHAPLLFDSMLTMEKFKVPELCVRILIGCVRENQDRIDLLYDCCSAFCHEYATDFTFFNKFIEDEIVQLVPLEWRHQAFARLIDFFRPRHDSYPHKDCILLAKFIQHIIIPCFQHAFLTYPIDDVVGSKAWPDVEQTDTSIIWQFCLQIIEPYYNEGAQPGVPQLPVPEALKVALYQFCSLLVQRCPDHIHNSTSQRRPAAGNRSSDRCLRFFMLFCWNCIQNQTQVDLPEKYAGQFLIANLMEKFAINKNIMNQAIGSLLAAHHQDTRSIVGKSLEIIIPVIASRGDGSDLQLFQTIKDMIERTHQHTQGLSEQHSLVIHCLNILTRHFKVFFRVRQQIADLLMYTAQRLYASQPNVDNKRLVLEICETILRWENQRKDLLERAQAQDPPLDRISQPTPLPTIDLENAQLQFDRRIIDQLLQWLLRIATSTDQAGLSQSYPGADPFSLVRKALVILRRAIKPQVFGHVPLRTNYLERQLILPQQRMAHEELPQEQQTAIYNQVTQTLDIILALVSYLPPESIAEFMHSLQRPVSACVSCTNMSVAQSCFKLIGKLAEQTAASQGAGLAEFEILNAEIGRYLNDSMNFVASGGFSQQMSPVHSMQLISKCLALLRVICKFHPTYLESTCYVAFLKMFQRLVLEYNPAISLQASSTGSDPRHKISQDLCSCMDLLKGRLHALNTEARRLIDKELQALVDKPIFGRLKDPNHQSAGAVKRVAEKLMEILVELVRLDAGCALTSPMGLKLLVHVYERMQPYGPYPSDIMLKFLSAVQLVFEDKALRKSDLAEKLHQPFFWGLACMDQNVWFQFFRLFETQFPPTLFERLMHMIGEQNWLPLRSKFWIPHCVHLLLRSATAEGSSLRFKNCSTFAATASKLTQHLQLPTDVDSMDTEIQTAITSGTEQVQETTAANATDNASSLDSNSQVSSNELFVSGKTLLDMLSHQHSNLADLSRQVAEMSHVDQRLASSIFVDLFSSLWSQVPTNEKRQRIFEFFLESSQLANSTLPLTPLLAFHRAARKVSLRVDSILMEKIAIEHGSYFEILNDLEQQQRKNGQKQLSLENYTEQVKRVDSLAAVYAKLGEEDLRTELWKGRAAMNGTYRSMQLYNQGMFKEARLQSRLTMNEGRDLMFEDAIIGPQRSTANSTQPSQTPAPVVESTNSQESDPANEIKDEPMEVSGQEAGQSQDDQPAPLQSTLDIRALDLEMRSLESIWTQSCRELNDWSTLTRYANCNDVANTEVLANCAWHQSEWTLARELVPQIEASGSRRAQFNSALLQAKAQVANGEFVQRMKIDELGTQLITDWRQLPSIITPAHMQLVRMAQRVQEVTEANQINKVAVEKMVRYPPGAHLPIPTPSKQFPALLTHRYAIDPELISTIKQTVKTWRNRPLTIIDPASHWSDTFTWRVQQYWSIMRMFENADSPGVAQQSQVMHPLHSISQAQINYARTLRKNELYDEAAHELSMLHSMSQVHPIDAGMALHEQTKCLVGLAEKIRRQQKYGEQCIVGAGANTSANYLESRKDPDQLIQTAMNLLESARLDVLSNDQLARLLAVKASLHSQYDPSESTKADELFVASARLIESTTATPSQQTNVPNTMAASQLVWRQWSLHWERRFHKEFDTIWVDGQLNVEACRKARKTGLETMTSLLECMRTATDNRSKKFAARFFHFLRAVHALEDQLNANGHDLNEIKEEAMEDTQSQSESLTIEEVLKKHAGSVSAISWLFWLEQIVHEIRTHSSKEMSKILCSVADAYPQQVLVVLRSSLWPELITQRIKFIQQRLPLIADWIRCAPPLDVAGTNAANDATDEDKATENPREQLAEIGRLEKHKEEFADSFTLWRARRRDRQLIAARRRLQKFDQEMQKLNENTVPEARQRFANIRQRLQLRYLRLKHMQKLGILPKAPLQVPRCLNLTVPQGEDLSDNWEVEGNENEDIYTARIRLPNADNQKPYHILIDTSNLEVDGRELELDIQEDKDPDLELPELSLKSLSKQNDLDSWVELLLKAVDSMCVGRYADVRALNTILNELDGMQMPRMQLLHSELVRVAEFVHNETFSQLRLNPDQPNSIIASKQTQQLMSTFKDQLLVDTDLDEKDEEFDKLSQQMINDLNTLNENDWPLVNFAKILCSWLIELEKKLESIDELIPLRQLSPYLASFNSKVAHLDMCSGWSSMKTHFSTQISQFLPLCRRFYRHSGVVTAFSVLSQNGKTYTYIMEREPQSMERTRSQQLFSLLNSELMTNREVCRRSAQFALPDLVHTGLNYQLMECCPMSGAPTYQLFRNAEHYGSNLRSLLDIGASCLKFQQTHAKDQELPAENLMETDGDATNESGQETIELDQVITKDQAQSLWQLLHDSLDTKPLAIQDKHMLTDWMQNTYPDAATHWTVRKKFSTQWALFAAVELAAGLLQMSPGRMHMDMASAQLFSTSYEFAVRVDKENGKFSVQDSPQFRLTPNLAEYMQVGVQEDGRMDLPGHLSGTFMAACRALAARSYSPFVRILLWDLCELKMPNEWTDAEKAERMIKATQELPEQLSERIKSLAIFTNNNFKAVELLEQSASSNAWQQINPAQHPWF